MTSTQKEVALLGLRFVLFFLRLTCLSACDRTIRLAAERGKLMTQEKYSPFLGRSTSCIWEIEAPIGRRIEVVIHVFQIAGRCCSCEKGYVEFRDGLNASSPLIGRYCAKKKPVKVYSSYNLLRVRFFSAAKLKHTVDKSTLNKFRASFFTICGGFVRARSGVISSPGYPNYTSNVTCLYTIVVPYGWVKLNFTDFGRKAVMNGQCKFDFIELIEMTNVKFKNTRYGPEPLCGQLKSTYVFSRGQQLSLLYSHQSSSRFAAKFEATTAVAPCGGMVVDAGYVYSYNYPYQYPGNTDCRWKIGVRPHQYIKLTLLRFNFTCAGGKVEIYDGWSVNSFLIGDYCSNPPEGDWIKSRSEKLLVRAKSGGNVTVAGTFVLSVTAVDEGLCSAEQFTCTSRECLQRESVCDGMKDCADGSDEQQNCPAKKKSKSLYALWIIFGLVVVVILGFWIRRTWRRSMIHHTLRERRARHTCDRDGDYADEMPPQSEAPPTYNEALGHASTSPPSYQETLPEDTPRVVLQQNNTVQFFPPHSDNPSQHLLPEHEPETSNDAPSTTTAL